PNDMRQRLAIDELHGIEVDAALAADVVDRYDVGVMQPGRGLRLVAKALQLLAVQSAGKRQNLERDSAVKGNLLGLVDDAHAACRRIGRSVHPKSDPRPKIERRVRLSWFLSLSFPVQKTAETFQGPAMPHADRALAYLEESADLRAGKLLQVAHGQDFLIDLG